MPPTPAPDSLSRDDIRQMSRGDLEMFLVTALADLARRDALVQAPEVRELIRLAWMEGFTTEKRSTVSNERRMNADVGRIHAQVIALLAGGH